MIMGLGLEILGLVLFLGAHVFTSMRAPRAALIARIGEGPYKGLFSLVAIVGIVLLGYGYARYRAEGLIPIWYPPPWTRHIVVALMWPASIAVVAAYIPGDIKRVLKHPMLVGVKIWAVAHLCANGDLGGIILFGSVLLWAGYDRMTLKRRSVRRWPAHIHRCRVDHVLQVRRIELLNHFDGSPAVLGNLVDVGTFKQAQTNIGVAQTIRSSRPTVAVSAELFFVKNCVE